MRIERPWFEFRMELASKKPRVILDFDYFNKAVLRIFPGENKARFRENIFIFRIEFVSVAVTLIDIKLSVDFFCEWAFFQSALILAQPHGSSHVFHSFDVPPFEENLVWRLCIKLWAVGFFEWSHISGIFDSRALHSKAYTKKGNFMPSCIRNGSDFSFNPPNTKTPRDQNSVGFVENRLALPFQVFGFNPGDIHF